MKPYRTSLPARILAGSASYLLIGGGIAALAGVPIAFALPILVMPPVLGGMFGIGIGIEDHPAPTALMVVLLPLIFWPFLIVLQLALTRMPLLGWAFVAAGALPLGAMVLASATRREDAQAALPAGAHSAL